MDLVTAFETFKRTGFAYYKSSDWQDELLQPNPKIQNKVEDNVIRRLYNNQRIEKVLSTFPVELKLILYLHISGYTSKEISEQFSIPMNRINSVWKQLHRMRSKQEKLMKQR